VKKHTNRRPEELTPIDEAVSTLGKYAICFGQHFRPTICYDVVGINRITGECIRRHYGDKKDQAMTYWQEFKAAMTAPRVQSEEDEKDGYSIFGPS
jgi:hypothetical protein